LDTAPDAAWHPRFVAMAEASPLPEVAAASAIYEADRRDENIAAVAVASAPWNFTPAGVAAGRELLARMPYNSAAVDWSDAHFDHAYAARWWPADIPVLRLAGAEDRIVWQGGWDDPRFRTANVMEVIIPAAGHFPWIEDPAAVGAAFDAFARRLV
jgi:pimeloyl-ACP methyl ester carboxylesterase